MNVSLQHGHSDVVAIYQVGSHEGELRHDDGGDGVAGQFQTLRRVGQMALFHEERPPAVGCPKAVFSGTCWPHSR